MIDNKTIKNNKLSENEEQQFQILKKELKELIEVKTKSQNENTPLVLIQNKEKWQKVEENCSNGIIIKVDKLTKSATFSDSDICELDTAFKNRKILYWGEFLSDIQQFFVLSAKKNCISDFFEIIFGTEKDNLFACLPKTLRNPLLMAIIETANQSQSDKFNLRPAYLEFKNLCYEKEIINLKENGKGIYRDSSFSSKLLELEIAYHSKEIDIFLTEHFKFFIYDLLKKINLYYNLPEQKKKLNLNKIAESILNTHNGFIEKISPSLINKLPAFIQENLSLFSKNKEHAKSASGTYLLLKFISAFLTVFGGSIQASYPDLAFKNYTQFLIANFQKMVNSMLSSKSGTDENIKKSKSESTDPLIIVLSEKIKDFETPLKNKLAIFFNVLTEKNSPSKISKNEIKGINQDPPSRRESIKSMENDSGKRISFTFTSSKVTKNSEKFEKPESHQEIAPVEKIKVSQEFFLSLNNLILSKEFSENDKFFENILTSFSKKHGFFNSEQVCSLLFLYHLKSNDNLTKSTSVKFISVIEWIINENKEYAKHLLGKKGMLNKYGVLKDIILYFCAKENFNLLNHYLEIDNKNYDILVLGLCAAIKSKKQQKLCETIWKKIKSDKISLDLTEANCHGIDATYLNNLHKAEIKENFLRFLLAYTVTHRNKEMHDFLLQQKEIKNPTYPEKFYDAFYEPIDWNPIKKAFNENLNDLKKLLQEYKHLNENNIINNDQNKISEKIISSLIELSNNFENANSANINNYDMAFVNLLHEHLVTLLDFCLHDACLSELLNKQPNIQQNTESTISIAGLINCFCSIEFNLQGLINEIFTKDDENFNVEKQKCLLALAEKSLKNFYSESFKTIENQQIRLSRLLIAFTLPFTKKEFKQLINGTKFFSDFTKNLDKIDLQTFINFYLNFIPDNQNIIKLLPNINSISNKFLVSKSIDINTLIYIGINFFEILEIKDFNTKDLFITNIVFFQEFIANILFNDSEKLDDDTRYLFSIMTEELKHLWAKAKEHEKTRENNLQKIYFISPYFLVYQLLSEDKDNWLLRNKGPLNEIIQEFCINKDTSDSHAKKILQSLIWILRGESHSEIISKLIKTASIYGQKSSGCAEFIKNQFLLFPESFSKMLTRVFSKVTQGDFANTVLFFTEILKQFSLEKLQPIQFTHLSNCFLNKELNKLFDQLDALNFMRTKNKECLKELITFDNKNELTSESFAVLFELRIWIEDLRQFSNIQMNTNCPTPYIQTLLSDFTKAIIEYLTPKKAIEKLKIANNKSPSLYKVPYSEELKTEINQWKDLSLKLDKNNSLVNKQEKNMFF